MEDFDPSDLNNLITRDFYEMLTIKENLTTMLTNLKKLTVRNTVFDITKRN